MRNTPFWPARLTVRMNAEAMLQFTREEAFCANDFPFAMTSNVRSRHTTAEFFLPALKELEKVGEDWLLKGPEDLPRHLEVFGLKVPLSLDDWLGQSCWELKLSKHGGWDVFSINDHALAVLGGDDAPPGPLPPGDRPLGVSFCARRSLSDLPASSRVTSLFIHGLATSSASSAEVIRGMTELTDLQITHCPSLNLGRMLPESLRRLDLSLYRGKLSPNPLASLVHLEELALSMPAIESACPGELAGLQFPGSLRRVSLTLPFQVNELEFLRELRQLRELKIERCLGVTALKGIAELTELEDLTLHGPSLLHDLGPLQNLQNLRRLYLCGFGDLRDLRPLRQLKGLCSLSLVRCEELRDLSPLTQNAGLTSLIVADCAAVQDLTMFEGNRSLHVIHAGAHKFSKASNKPSIEDYLE
jgi:hypothetical protein